MDKDHKLISHLETIINDIDVTCGGIGAKGPVVIEDVVIISASGIDVNGLNASYLNILSAPYNI